MTRLARLEEDVREGHQIFVTHETSADTKHEAIRVEYHALVREINAKLDAILAAEARRDTSHTRWTVGILAMLVTTLLAFIVNSLPRFLSVTPR